MLSFEISKIHGISHHSMKFLIHSTMYLNDHLTWLFMVGLDLLTSCGSCLMFMFINNIAKCFCKVSHTYLTLEYILVRAL